MSGAYQKAWKQALPAYRKQQARQLREGRARVWDCPACGQQFKPVQVKGVPQYPICPSCGRDCDDSTSTA